jgi:drug/metabolite transporter (DMT)-like permease
MVRLLTSLLALLTGVAGWFYLFFSAAARKLDGIEQHRANRWRIRLRRVNGVVMILLAALLYGGTFAADERIHPKIFILIWMGVTLLVGVVLLLVLIDVRFTIMLRGRLRKTPTGGEQAEMMPADHDNS